MMGELQKRRILGRGKEVFIGVDVHKVCQPKCWSGHIVEVRI